jgi:hypothetical protein
MTDENRPLQHIDLNTVTVDDLAFKVPFDLKAERSDCRFPCGASRLQRLTQFCGYRHPRFPRLVRLLV